MAGATQSDSFISATLRSSVWQINFFPTGSREPVRAEAMLWAVLLAVTMLKLQPGSVVGLALSGTRHRVSWDRRQIASRCETERETESQNQRQTSAVMPKHTSNFSHFCSIILKNGRGWLLGLLINTAWELTSPLHSLSAASHSSLRLSLQPSHSTTDPLFVSTFSNRQNDGLLHQPIQTPRPHLPGSPSRRYRGPHGCSHV